MNKKAWNITTILLLIFMKQIHAETVTGVVEKVSDCEYRNGKYRVSIRINNHWYLGNTSREQSATAAVFLAHEWVLSAAMLSMVSGHTVTVHYTNTTVDNLPACRSDIAGTFDLLQINYE